jgi:hypothetical protein
MSSDGSDSIKLLPTYIARRMRKIKNTNQFRITTERAECGINIIDFDSVF